MFVNFPLIVYLVTVYGVQDIISYQQNHSFIEIHRIRRQSSCERNEYSCDNGQCINLYSKCDGTKDCNDGSDETRAVCKDIRCPLKSFRCSYGACIDISLKCNGKSDCNDGSDEDCPVNVRGGTPPCRSSQFACKSGQCIRKYDICDVKKNCNDGSDETRDLCWEINCPQGSFKCTDTGACLDMPRVCDGNKDCTDGSDEDKGCIVKGDPVIRTNKPTLDSVPVPRFPVCGSSNLIGKIEPLIIGGDDAPVGSFPWHAGLYYSTTKDGVVKWEQGCAGSLITDQFVITAAHCVGKKNVEEMRVALGKYKRSWYAAEDTEQKVTVSRVMWPYEFNTQNYVFDVGLVMLATKITMGAYVMPVCRGLPNGANYVVGKKLYVVGWGQTENISSGKSSENLTYTDVKYMEPKNCQKGIPSYLPIFDKICTFKNATKTYTDEKVSVVQPGDSGGGMTALYDNLHYIFGIVSLKVNPFTLFTNLTWQTHITWIEVEIRKYDDNFRWIQA